MISANEISKIEQSLGIKLEPWQKNSLESSNSMNWTTKSRNTGRTTVSLIKFLTQKGHTYCLPSKSMLIDANKDFAIVYFETMVRFHDRMIANGLTVRKLENKDEYRKGQQE